MVITPAYNEAGNLGAIYERLRAALDAARLDWRWVVVDDHSADRTLQEIQALATRDPRVGGIRFSRNCGSHAAITCGLRHVPEAADLAIVLAADLQDPPEIIEPMLQQWRAGAHTVWAVRRRRVGERRVRIGFASLYWWMMRRVVGLHTLPATGSDYLLLDRRVVGAVKQCEERNTSILALIAWLGFEQSLVEYDKQPRHSGRSGWTLRKKLTLIVDSVTAFSPRPLAAAGWLGAVWIAAALLTALAATGDVSVPAALLPAAVLLTGGVQLLCLAIAGAYLWRALEETRRRPWFVIEETVNLESLAGVPAPVGAHAGR